MERRGREGLQGGVGTDKLSRAKIHATKLNAYAILFI